MEIQFEGKRFTDKLSLIDVTNLTEKYIHISHEFFDTLINNVKAGFPYSMGKGIQSVRDPLDKDWSENPWIFLMVKDNSDNVNFWFLFKREKNLTGYLVAIGPDSYYEILRKKDTNKSEELKKMIEYIASYPNKFNILMLVPNFID
jgi:hypothetical protein